MNDQTERNLEIYCDLSLMRYECLRMAACGQLSTMNGATHQAMRALIDRNYRMTPAGRELLDRAGYIMIGRLPQGEPLVVIRGSAAVARDLRKTGYPWINSAHIKVLESLTRAPQQAFGHLVNVYSYRVIKDLLDHGLVDGQECLGGAFTVTETGRRLLHPFVVGQESLL